MAEGICERKEPKLLLYQLMETGGRILGRYCQSMWYSEADILCRLSSQKGIIHKPATEVQRRSLLLFYVFALIYQSSIYRYM
jgi:hypothetical protein